MTRPEAYLAASNASEKEGRKYFVCRTGNQELRIVATENYWQPIHGKIYDVIGEVELAVQQ